MFLSKRIWAATHLLLPLVMTFGSLIDAVSIPRFTLLLGSTTLISLLLLLKERAAITIHAQQFFSTPIGMGLGAYVLVGLCSSGMALSLSESLWEWFKIVGWCSAIFISSFLLKQKGTLLLLCKASLLALLVVESIALKEFAGIIQQLEEDKILYLVNATFEHKNLLATGLVLSLPFSGVVFFQAKEKPWKGLALLVAGLAIVLILITQSRSAWLALGVALLFVLVTLLSNSSKRAYIFKAPTLMIGGLILGIGLGLLWFFSSQNQVANAPAKRLQALLTYEETKNEHTETIRERLQLWNNTLEMIQDAPLVGVGLGNWKIHFPKYSMAGLRSEQGVIFFQRPHNDYLWVFSEMGIGGILAYLLILGSSIWAGVQLIRKAATQDTANYAIAVAITAGLVAFVVFSFFDFPKERAIHLLWSGLLVAVAYSYYDKEKKDNGLRYLAYVIPILTLGGTFFVAQRWQAEQQLQQVLQARSQQLYASVLTGLEDINTSIYELDPAATPINCYKGEVLYLQNRLPEALAAYQAAHQVHPYHLHSLNNLATTHFGLNNSTLAQKYFEQVLQIAPHFPDANRNMAAIAYNQQDIQKALYYIGNGRPRSYEDAQFLQFLQVISAAYCNLLLEQEQLQALHPYIKQFSQTPTWQVQVQEKALKNQKRYDQQIHLDLLYIAQEEQAITAEEANLLHSFLKQFPN